MGNLVHATGLKQERTILTVIWKYKLMKMASKEKIEMKNVLRNKRANKTHGYLGSDNHGNESFV